MCHGIVLWCTCEHLLLSQYKCPFEGVFDGHVRSKIETYYSPGICILCKQTPTPLIESLKRNQLSCHDVARSFKTTPAVDNFADCISTYFNNGQHLGLNQPDANVPGSGVDVASLLRQAALNAALAATPAATPDATYVATPDATPAAAHVDTPAATYVATPAATPARPSPPRATASLEPEFAPKNSSRASPPVARQSMPPPTTPRQPAAQIQQQRPATPITMAPPQVQQRRSTTPMPMATSSRQPMPPPSSRQPAPQIQQQPLSPMRVIPPQQGASVVAREPGNSGDIPEEDIIVYQALTAWNREQNGQISGNSFTNVDFEAMKSYIELEERSEASSQVSQNALIQQQGFQPRQSVSNQQYNANLRQLQNVSHPQEHMQSQQNVFSQQYNASPQHPQHGVSSQHSNYPQGHVQSQQNASNQQYNENPQPLQNGASSPPTSRPKGRALSRKNPPKKRNAKPQQPQHDAPSQDDNHPPGCVKPGEKYNLNPEIVQQCLQRKPVNHSQGRAQPQQTAQTPAKGPLHQMSFVTNGLQDHENRRQIAQAQQHFQAQQHVQAQRHVQAQQHAWTPQNAQIQQNNQIQQNIQTQESTENQGLIPFDGTNWNQEGVYLPKENYYVAGKKPVVHTKRATSPLSGFDPTSPPPGFEVNPVYPSCGNVSNFPSNFQQPFPPMYPINATPRMVNHAQPPTQNIGPQISPNLMQQAAAQMQVQGPIQNSMPTITPGDLHKIATVTSAKSRTSNSKPKTKPIPTITIIDDLDENEAADTPTPTPTTITRDPTRGIQDPSSRVTKRTSSPSSRASSSPLSPGDMLGDGLDTSSDPLFGDEGDIRSVQVVGTPDSPLFPQVGLQNPGMPTISL